MKKNTWKLKTTKKKTISNIINKLKRGFNSPKATPKERINIKRGSKTQKKTLGSSRPPRRKPLATQ
jgi:hypothetical protein